MAMRKSGERIGEYELISELGRGGMSDVYRVYNHRKARSEALKVLRVQAASVEDAGRFQREIAIGSKLTHPNIVAVYEAGVMKEEGVYYIAMEAMEGTLRDYLKAQKSGYLKLDEAATIMAALAAALDYAHSQKVIHRDIKPENVLYQTGANRERRWCLADFGIARAADDAHFTRAGEAIGTVTYMAPERLSGDPAAPGPASDQYALGVVLYEMLTGAPPFSGAPEDIMRAQLELRPDPPSKRNPQLPTEADDIVLRMLAKRPRDRYPSASAAATDLQAAAGMLPDDTLRKMYARAAALATDPDLDSPAIARVLMETVLDAAPNFRDGQRVMQRIEERERNDADAPARFHDAPTKKTLLPKSAPLLSDASNWPGHLFPTRKAELGREVALAAGASADGTLFGTRVRVSKGATLRGHVYSTGDIILEDGATVTGTAVARGRLELGANCRARSVFARSVSVGQSSQVRRWTISEGEMVIASDAQVGGAHALGPISIARGGQVMSPSMVSAHAAVTLGPEVKVGELPVSNDNSFALDGSGRLHARLATNAPPAARTGTIVTSLLDHRLLRAITAAKVMLGADAGPVASTMLDKPRAATGPLPVEPDDATALFYNLQPTIMIETETIPTSAPTEGQTRRIPFSELEPQQPPSYLATEEVGEAATQPMVVAYLYALLWQRFFRLLKWWILALPIVVFISIVLLLYLNATSSTPSSNATFATIVLVVMFAVIGGGLLAVILLKPSIQNLARGDWMLTAQPFSESGDDYLLLDTLKQKPDDPSDVFHLPRADQTALLSRTNATLAVAPPDQASGDPPLPLAAQAELIENLTEIARLTATQEYTDYPAYALARDSEAFAIVSELLKPGADKATLPPPKYDYEVQELPLAADEEGLDDEEALRRRIITINARLDAEERAKAPTELAIVPIAPPLDPATVLPSTMPLELYRGYVGDLTEFAALAEPLLNIWRHQREGLGAMRAWSSNWRAVAGFWRNQTEAHHAEISDLLTAADTIFSRAADALAYEIKPLLEQVESDRALMEGRIRQLAAQRTTQAQTEYGRRIATEEQLQAELSGREVGQREQLGRLEQRERSEEATLNRLRDEQSQAETQIEVRINQVQNQIKNAAKIAHPVDVSRSNPSKPLPPDPTDALPLASRKVGRIASLFSEISGPFAQLTDRYETIRQQSAALTQSGVPYEQRLQMLAAMLPALRNLRGEMSSDHDVIVGLSRDIAAVNQELAVYISGLPRSAEVEEENAAARQRLLQLQNQAKSLQQQIDGMRAGYIYNQLDTNVRRYEELVRGLPPQVELWAETVADIEEATAALFKTREERQRMIEALAATHQQIEDSQRKAQQLTLSRDREVAEYESQLDTRVRTIAADAARQQEEIRRHLTELEQTHSEWQSRHAAVASGSFTRYVNFDAESMELKAETVESLLDYIETSLRRASELVEATQRLLERCLFKRDAAAQSSAALAPLLDGGALNFLIPVWLVEYRPWLFGKRTYYALTPVSVRFERKPRWGAVGMEMIPRSSGAQTLFASRAHLSDNYPLIRFIVRHSALASRDGRDNLRAKIDHLAHVGFINFALVAILKFTIGWRNLFDFAPRRSKDDAPPNPPPDETPPTDEPAA
jgi:Protein kinase domain